MFSIPNILTLGNLLSGCIGIVMVVNGDSAAGALWVWIAAGFDFFDGFAARALKVSSPIGKDLDSLADMVSFGVLPSFVMFEMLNTSAGVLDSFTGDNYIPFVAFIIAAFSALRLAKFNNDDRQSDSFIGLPTPSNALFITAIPFVELELVHNQYVLIGVTIVFSLLLISEIRMFSLKVKNYSISDNFWIYLGVIVSGVLLFLIQVQAIPVIISGYILISVIIHFTKGSKQ